MLKRKRQDEEERRLLQQPASKRSKAATSRNCLPDLSDELLLKILSYLSVEGLTKVERVCLRFQRLASDNEIWKEKYYMRFVRPRARRLPTLSTLSENEREGQALHYASKSARWLNHNVSSRDSTAVDWKRRYKVKLNWTKGRCKAHEVTLDCPYQPRILVKIGQGTIYTADEGKLQSYCQRTRPRILKTHYWTDGKRPTAMDVDRKDNITFVTVGFSNGSLEVLEDSKDGSFALLLHHSTKSASAITSLATSWPYILTMSANHHLSLLAISHSPERVGEPTIDLLASLRADSLLLPVSLAVRRVSNTLIASIAYSFSRLNAGWCLGLQEIRLNLADNILGSRLTSTIDTPMQDFPFRKGKLSTRSTSTAPFALHPTMMSPPASLSHSGCYILAGLPDNTLMVYTITSNQEKLEISAGRRLFGHTSSVSGAEVSDRGKALSISAKGDEIRVWELEDLLSSWSLQKTSTQLQPRQCVDDLNFALVKRGAGLGLAIKEIKDEFAANRHWVGFDDEQVVVLGERDQRQILSCYDFA